MSLGQLKVFIGFVLITISTVLVICATRGLVHYFHETSGALYFFGGAVCVFVNVMIFNDVKGWGD